ncbi:hypothetical protein NBRC116188_30420 [Oceaniserpentilla sp. 4NH20-0058]|uniref:hypothetical protein n=1 Tax=Oceaniserpentilla sp. 4NH20-0058 TaxID=3127660 RepID=UPI00310400AB
MKKLTILLMLWAFISSVEANTECPEEERIKPYLQFFFPILGLAAWDNLCSHITAGDFNADGKNDITAVLSEVKPTEKYADGTLWYRTYVVVLLAGNLPYNQFQTVFIRTDGNNPGGVSVNAIKTDRGHDVVVEVAGYSHTRYSWGKFGFDVLKHSAD